MAARYYQDPGGVTRDVAYHVEPATEKEYAAAESSEIEAILLGHVARGAIARNECADWERRLRQDRAIAVEVLDALPGNDALADRRPLVRECS